MKKQPQQMPPTVIAATCQGCGHPMSARSEMALAYAVADHFLGAPTCELAMAVRVA
jgi:hypothetical protein